MKFEDYHYERPNLESLKEEFLGFVAQIESATTVDEVAAAIKGIQALQNNILTLSKLVTIRHSIDTRDTFYDEEQEFWNESGPVISEWETTYYKAVLNSPFRNELNELLPETFFKIAENGLRIFDVSIIPLLQTENKLASEYDKLIASAEIEHNGEIYNLPGMKVFTQSTDRQERKTALTAISQFFEKNLAEFDRIYDELVKTRHQIALELGFKDFVEVGYLRMNRLDYDRQDVEIYRQEVLKHVVPLAEKLFNRQKERLGLDALKVYDLELEFESGNAKPKGTPEEIVANGVKMYHELSNETGEFIDFMVERNLLDLVTKPGKQGGGYCDYIPNYESPFIFSNFNGTSGDIDVLTHEAGHAFQVYQSRWIQTPESVWPTYESCEIHSMSMEFFAYPWMELFFEEQTLKYKYSHLFSTVSFLPYGVLVDHFQHEVYQNPEMTPEQRRDTWRRLEAQYNPWKDNEGITFLETGARWFSQAHIFGAPFYYIDYTLAQVCALQFWERNQVDQDPTAWQDYLTICRIGGTQSFKQIVASANLKSPFEPGSLSGVVAKVDTYLDSISEEDLNA
ncbi:M3 family oligoendopeptidase [Facklamia sp. 252]|uniref:M3 family oligoendopeptidase n=1 Tax=Aerococcaceae TaxID=186827 RepID=UPI0013D47777|nr:M3 family oligoendopeptidase [Facklamia sp. 252]NEW64346.1 M3 family oligoendopeptidase [Facklamia sp. 252]QQD64808.1 M3 family oligoendopeptidase [Aerococcaceae bacterium zg-252]